MPETIRYTRLGNEDLNLGTGTFEARLADGRVVVLQQIDVGAILSDPALSSQSVSLDSLTVATLTVTGTITPLVTLTVPEKVDPSSPVSGEVWINSGGTFLEYAGDEGTPTKHQVVGHDTVQILTNKTLDTATIQTPVLSGTASGTYELGGTPSLGAPLNASDEDITSLDEVHFADAAANPTAIGRLRRSGANLKWHNGITPEIVVLLEAFQTLLNKTLATPSISNPVLSGTTTGTYTLGGTYTIGGTPLVGNAAPATPTAYLLYRESLIKAFITISFSGATPTNAEDFNVTSITDLGTGSTRITYATAMTSATHPVSATIAGAGGLIEVSNKGVNSADVQTTNAAGVATDMSFYFFAGGL